jgi:hypothetical protein
MKKSGGISALEKFINRAENYPISSAGFTAVFISITFVRDFLEALIEPPHALFSAGALSTTVTQLGVLFNLEWISLFMALTVVLKIMTGEKTASVMKILLLFYSIIIIVPFLDLAAAFPGGCKIDYLYTMKDYLQALLLFFIPGASIPVCPGIRLEVFAGFIMCGAYILIKSRSFLRALAGSLLLYFLAVSSMAFPVFILLPLFPFSPSNFDSIVNFNFFGTALDNALMSRVSVMIFLFSTPLIFLLMALHYGKKILIEFSASFFSPLSLVYASAVFSAFIAARSASGGPVFTGPFDIFFLAAALLAALYISLFDGISSKPWSSLIVPLSIFIAVACAALSFKMFFIFIFILCLRLFFEKEPFNLESFKAVKPLQNSINIFLMYVSGSLLFFSPVFSAPKTAAAAFAAVMVCFGGLFFRDRSKTVYNTACLLAAGIFIAAGFIH